MTSAARIVASCTLLVACDATGPRIAATRNDAPPAAVSPGDAPDAGAPSNGAALERDPGTRGSSPDAGCGASSPRSPVWRLGLGDVNVLAATSVATDDRGDAFVASTARGVVKLDPSGNIAWSKPFGELVAAGNSSVYVAGAFSDQTMLDECRLAPVDGTNVYLATLDTNGNVVRCTALGSGASGSVTGLAADPNGGAIVSGPGLGTVKLDPEGHVQWRQSPSGAVAVDTRGNALVTGALTGSAAFGDVTLVSAGGDDVFVAKLDTNGRYVFALRFGDAGTTQSGQGVTSDPAGDVLVSGVADGSIDFGDGAIEIASEACPSEGGCRLAGFVAKLDASGTTLWSRSLGSVRSLPGIASDSHGNVLSSGAYPGNAPPYRLPLLVEFDAAGNELRPPISPEADSTDIGAGYGVAFDHFGDAFWAMNVPPAPGATARSLLTKFGP